MRIRDETFLFRLDIKHVGDSHIDIYDRSWTLMHDLDITSGTQSVDLEICLPNKLTLCVRNIDSKIHNSPSVELLRMSLAGIDIQKESMLKIIDYRFTSESVLPGPIDISRFQSSKTLYWQSGYVEVNLFHPDPFALHLLIDNKIKFLG